MAGNARGRALRLSEETLGALGVGFGDVAREIEAMLREREQGRVYWADKAILRPPDGRYIMSVMAAAEDPPLLVVKTVVVNEASAALGLPQLNGAVLAFDAATGVPAASLDANWITAMRTPALSLVAAERLCAPGAETMGLVGCGVQARAHLEAFAERHPLKRALLYGRGRPNIEATRRRAEALGVEAAVCADPREAAEGADILVTSVTISPPCDPFLDASWLKPGSFAVITDSSVPWRRESYAAFDRIAIDDMEQEAGMASKLADPALVAGDLAGLAAGRVEGRRAAGERTAFIFRSHPVGDLAISALAVRRARELGKGEPMPM